MANLLTLAAGSSITLTVTDQQSIVLNNGRSDVARLQIATGAGAGRVVTAFHNGRREYGPFGAGTITISAVSGELRYELSGDGVSPLDDDGQPLTPTENQSVRALVSEAGEARTFARVVVFGDSIPGHNAVYTTGTDPDGIVPPPWFVDGAVDHSWRGWGWISWVGPISMQRIQVVKNYCVQTNGLLAAGTSPVGQPVSAQVTRFLADRAAGRVKATRAIIHVGTNDNQSTIAACAAELLTQIARLGMPVDLVSSPPRGGTPTTVVGDGLQLWAWLQQWRATCKRIADASGGSVKFIDAYAQGNTPATVPDVMQAGYTYDDIHTNSAYGFRIADAYVSSLLPSGLAGDLDLWPNNSNASSSGGANLIDQGVINPVFGTTSGGTGTGTVAGSYTITNVGTATHSGSVVANPNGIGNMQRIAITSNANNDGVNIATASFHAAGGTFLSAGDEAYLQCLVTIGAGGIYPKNMRLQLACFDGTTTWVRKLFDIDAAKEVAMPLSAARTLLLRTPKFVVPSGLTFASVTGSLRPIFAAAGSCTIDVGNFECRRTRAGTGY
jgi:hypothetical protein